MKASERIGGAARKREHDDLCARALSLADNIGMIVSEKHVLEYAPSVSIREAGDRIDTCYRLHTVAPPIRVIGQEFESLVKNGKGWIVGYCDLLLKLGRAGCRGQYITILIECKTTNEDWSAGDVLRQLKLYRDALMAWDPNRPYDGTVDVAMVLFLESLDGVSIATRSLLESSGVFVVSESSLVPSNT